MFGSFSPELIADCVRETYTEAYGESSSDEESVGDAERTRT
jgi:hypothetical protein